MYSDTRADKYTLWSRLAWLLAAALVVYMLPSLPPMVLLVARAVALGGLALYGSICLFAGVPVPRLVVAARVLLATLAVVSAAAATLLPFDLSVIAVYLSVVAAALAVGPSLAKAQRKWLYLAVLLGALSVVLGLISSSFQSGASNLTIAYPFLGSLLGCSTRTLYRWWRFDDNPTLERLTRGRLEAQTFLHVLRSRGPLGLRESFQRSRFSSKLSRLASPDVPWNERYDEILRQCRGAKTELAFRIAYWAAVSHRDMRLAMEIEQDATKVGVHILPQNPGNLGNSAEWSNLWARWADDDPNFRHLQDSLSNYDTYLVASA